MVARGIRLRISGPCWNGVLGIFALATAFSRCWCIDWRKRRSESSERSQCNDWLLRWDGNWEKGQLEGKVDSRDHLRKTVCLARKKLEESPLDLRPFQEGRKPI